MGVSIDVLFVCTAGRCRSPIAAAMLDTYAPRAGSPLVGRSGALVGAHGSVPPVGITVMRERGLELGGHRSLPVTPAAVASAALVLGMEREHVRAVVDAGPDAWVKTFTLKDFVRRVEKAAVRGRHQRFTDWLHHVGEGRTRDDIAGDDPDDDLVDPYGQRASVWREVVDELDDLVRRLIPNVS
ncbi:Low molecular weight phosphotyrosine protein phosphatase [Jiangella alba]|uniref:Low molecular weight phosphotyrosine protein phosphatase n=1 Tax=Jiangella alba TaxID=561176 RepID=A0A1H5PU33_9ACTN|nr:Low molecular weight phosphotyrosine protein phosphatase [Jiangella alba]